MAVSKTTGLKTITEEEPDDFINKDIQADNQGSQTSDQGSPPGHSWARTTVTASEPRPAIATPENHRSQASNECYSLQYLDPENQKEADSNTPLQQPVHHIITYKWAYAYLLFCCVTLTVLLIFIFTLPLFIPETCPKKGCFYLHLRGVNSTYFGT